MNELVVQFGAQGGLVGTLCIPTTVAPRPVAFILLNAGVVSRIGPHRINVKLARHLAGLGFASLRMDLSSQGDSRPAPGTQPHEKQVLLDLREALDHVARETGISQFIIAGICSGAVAAYYYAQQDPRVVGTWMLDGYTFHTWRSQVRRYLGKVTRQLGRGWHANVKALRQKLGRRSSADHEKVDYGSTHEPTKAEYALAMQTLAARGVRHFMMFSGDIHWYYNYPRQFHDAFHGHDWARTVTVEYLPHMDHTLTTLAAQGHVIERIGAWACTLDFCSSH